MEDKQWRHAGKIKFGIGIAMRWGGRAYFTRYIHGWITGVSLPCLSRAAAKENHNHRLRNILDISQLQYYIVVLVKCLRAEQNCSYLKVQPLSKNYWFHKCGNLGGMEFTLHTSQVSTLNTSLLAIPTLLYCTGLDMRDEMLLMASIIYSSFPEMI